MGLADLLKIRELKLTLEQYVERPRHDLKEYVKTCYHLDETNFNELLIRVKNGYETRRHINYK